jgi:hypothetical protein
MIIWMVRERVRLRHSVNRRLLALGEAHPRGGASWLAEVGSAKRDLGLWPSGDLCGEPVIRSWRNVCRRPQAVGQFRASRQDSARTLVHARCEWLLTRPVARSAAWASSTSSSRPKPPKIGFEHRIGRPRSLMGRSSVCLLRKKRAPKAITSPDASEKGEHRGFCLYTQQGVRIICGDDRKNE